VSFCNSWSHWYILQFSTTPETVQCSFAKHHHITIHASYIVTVISFIQCKMHLPPLTLPGQASLYGCALPCIAPCWLAFSQHHSASPAAVPTLLYSTLQCHLHLPAWYIFLPPLNVVPLPFSSLKQFYVLAWLILWILNLISNCTCTFCICLFLIVSIGAACCLIDGLQPLMVFFEMTT